MTPWNTLLQMVWEEQDRAKADAKKIEQRAHDMIRQITADATMNRDSLRSCYQRLVALEHQIREEAGKQNVKLPERQAS